MYVRLITISIKICRAIGLSYVRYDPERRHIELEQGPWLVYVIVLDILYLVLTPFVFYVMMDGFYRCQDLDMLSVAFSVVALSKALSMLNLICNIWLQRKRFARFGNGLLRMWNIYCKYIFNYSYWRRYFWKYVQGSARFLVLLHLHFGPGSTLTCEKPTAEVNRIAAIYIAVSVMALFMELVVITVDYTIYFVQDSFNSILGCLALEVQEMTQDLEWLPQRRGCYRNVYQQQLLAAWQRLWRRCMRLNYLFDEMLQIFQWHLLLSLFSSYLTEITIIFDFAIYINQNYADVDPLRLCYSLLLCIMYHLDTTSNFRVFYGNHVQWVKLMSSIQSFWIAVRSMKHREDEDILSNALSRQLEFAVLCLNRKLQQQPEKVRRLHIAGLFDMGSQTGMRRTTSIASSVLVLGQIAYKNYF